MSTKPHYFRIGIFVILALALVVAAVVVFGAGLLAQDKMYFETYFDESITGLSVGSPVEFRGVRIGQVETIWIRTARTFRNTIPTSGWCARLPRQFSPS